MMGTLPKRRPIGLLHSIACLTAVFLLQLSHHEAMSVTLRGGVDVLGKRVAGTRSCCALGKRRQVARTKALAFYLHNLPTTGEHI